MSDSVSKNDIHKTPISVDFDTDGVVVATDGGIASAAAPEITGSRGANAALTDLLASLDALGIIVDSSS
jgi:hypothetical protein